MTIATLTMNPALDITTATAEVRPTHKLRCHEPRYDAGGGGINVARVIHMLGGTATAVFPSGGPFAAILQRILAGEGVTFVPVPIAGQTRESFTVDEEATGEQYRFVLPGPTLSHDEQSAVIEALANLPEKIEYLVVSGSLPPGVEHGFYARIGALRERLGVRLVLDSSGAELRASKVAGAYLIKPSIRELADLVGRPIPGDDAAIAAAHGLIGEGVAEVIVISLGERGALLVTADHERRFAPIEVPVVSAVGAGDSMVGAIALGLSRGMGVDAAVCYGMAAGAATLMTPGTELARREDVERLHARMVAAHC